MSRKPDLIRPTYLHMAIPEDIRLKLDLFLFSTLEQRVPKGAYQRFFMGLTKDFFAKQGAQ